MSNHPQLIGGRDTATLLAAAEQRRLARGSSFESCLLDEVCSGLCAEFVHVWEFVADDEPQLLWKRGQASADSDRAMRAVRGQVVSSETRADATSARAASSFLTKCDVAEGVHIVLELAIPDEYADQQQILELVEVLADLHRRNLVSRLVQNSRREKDLQQILTLLHADLDPIRVATCLASDAAELLNCRRISVAHHISRKRWELVTATAVVHPDPRSDASRQICAIIEDACRGSSEDRRTPSHTKSRAYSVRPLSVSNRWEDADWAAVFEWAEEVPDVNRPHPHLAGICEHAALAFQNCREYSNAGLLSSFRRLPQAIRRGRLLAVGGIAAALAAGLVFAKLNLQIEVMGRLVPSERIFVFAPEDGVITDVFVEDGASVVMNGPLCTMRNEDLEIQLEAIEGELAATQARLAALDSMRGDRNLTQPGLLSVEQAELKEQLSALEAQSEILNRRIERLNVNATMVGRVYGDRIQELLKGRPVQRGQYLFELANPDGGWQLDMRIPEVDVRHVIREQAESGAALPVSFSVETAPDKELRTTLTRMSHATDIDEFGRLSVLGTAIPEKTDIVDPRPGAGVVGYIHCGSRPAGYVLFRRIIEAFQRRWWK